MEGSLDLGKGEPVGRQRGRIDPADLKQPQQTGHPFPAARAQSGTDLFVAHPQTELHERNLQHRASLAVVADVGDDPARLGRFDAVLKSRGMSERLNRGIDTDSAGKLLDLLYRIALAG